MGHGSFTTTKYAFSHHQNHPYTYDLIENQPTSHPTLQTPTSKLSSFPSPHPHRSLIKNQIFRTIPLACNPLPVKMPQKLHNYQPQLHPCNIPPNACPRPKPKRLIRLQIIIPKHPLPFHPPLWQELVRAMEQIWVVENVVSHCAKLCVRGDHVSATWMG